MIKNKYNNVKSIIILIKKTLKKKPIDFNFYQEHLLLKKKKRELKILFIMYFHGNDKIEVLRQIKHYIKNPIIPTIIKFHNYKINNWDILNRVKIYANNYFSVEEDKKELKNLVNYRDVTDLSEYYFRIEGKILYLYEFPFMDSPKGYVLFL
jgi:hypothetical protein